MQEVELCIAAVTTIMHLSCLTSIGVNPSAAVLSKTSTQQQRVGRCWLPLLEPPSMVQEHLSQHRHKTGSRGEAMEGGEPSSSGPAMAC